MYQRRCSLERYAVAMPKSWIWVDEKRRSGPCIKIFRVEQGETEEFLDGRLQISGYRLWTIASDQNSAMEVARTEFQKRSIKTPASHKNAGNIAELENRVFHSVFDS